MHAKPQDPEPDPNPGSGSKTFWKCFGESFEECHTEENMETWLIVSVFNKKS
jgi:hypothetical protein